MDEQILTSQQPRKIPAIYEPIMIGGMTYVV